MKKKKEKAYWTRSVKYTGDKTSYLVPKPKKWTFEDILNRIGVIIGIILLIFIVCSLSSCSVTEKQAQMEYEIDKLWLDYSYKRDSIIIEYNKPNK